MPQFGDDSNETNAELIQYHDPPLPATKIDAIRLDSIYRILCSRHADLCDIKNCLPRDPETCQKELMHHRADAKCKGGEIKHLCGENEELHNKNKRLKRMIKWAVNILPDR